MVKRLFLIPSHFPNTFIIRTSTFLHKDSALLMSASALRGPLEMTSLTSAARELPASVHQEGSQFGNTRVSGGVLVQGNVVGLTISAWRKVVLSV